MSYIYTVCVYKVKKVTGLTLYFVSLFVSPSLPLVSFGQLLHYADKRIVNIMKVYIERNNLQLELIRYIKQC